MARPVKEWRTKSNTYSLQLYHYGEYVGSIGFSELCQYIQDKGGEK